MLSINQAWTPKATGALGVYESGYGVGLIDFPAVIKCHDLVVKPGEKSHDPVCVPPDPGQTFILHILKWSDTLLIVL